MAGGGEVAPATNPSTGAEESTWDQGRAAPHDGTSCRPVPVSPSEFDARRHWRAFRVDSREAARAVAPERLAVAGVVLAFHALLAVWLARALAPAAPFEAIGARGPEQVLIVRFPEPRPEPPAELPEPPIPRPSTSAAARRDGRPERMPAPTAVEPPTSAAEAAPGVSAARLRDALSDDLRQQSMRARDEAMSPPRGFGRPAGPALGEVFDRPTELPGRRSRLDGVWAPDGESLAGELVRRATVEREFKDRWGGRIRCVISPVTFGLPVCAFGFAQEPLPDAPLAPNEAPRDGRVPLGTPRP